MQWIKPEYCPFLDRVCKDCEYFNKQYGSGCKLPKEQ